jgi:hypothetical protein
MRLKKLKQIQQLDIIKVFNIYGPKSKWLWPMGVGESDESTKNFGQAKDYWRLYSYYTRFLF